MSELAARKGEHLDLCARADVEHHVHRTLLDEVHLLHDALPELALEEVDLSCTLFGRSVRAPLVICAMSGGTPRSRVFNRALATVAQRVGLAMGVGSQRAMLADPSCADSYCVRDVAPDIPLLANLGAVQARDAGIARVREMVERIGADAISIHLNVAQELVQDDGDRDFRGCLAFLASLAEAMPVPVVVKETGCGFSPRTLEKLYDAGLRWVDVSGAGGTSWTAVEALRGSERQRMLGTTLREWGIPTAPAVVYAQRAGLSTIASGGIRNALDAARAIALGAQAAGLALPFLRAFEQDQLAGVLSVAGSLIEGLSAVALLTGARCVRDLQAAPRVLGPELRSWIG